MSGNVWLPLEWCFHECERTWCFSYWEKDSGASYSKLDISREMRPRRHVVPTSMMVVRIKVASPYQVAFSVAVPISIPIFVIIIYLIEVSSSWEVRTCADGWSNMAILQKKRPADAWSPPMKLCCFVQALRLTCTKIVPFYCWGRLKTKILLINLPREH